MSHDPDDEREDNLATQFINRKAVAAAVEHLTMTGWTGRQQTGAIPANQPSRITQTQPTSRLRMAPPAIPAHDPSDAVTRPSMPTYGGAPEQPAQLPSGDPAQSYPPQGGLGVAIPIPGGNISYAPPDDLETTADIVLETGDMTRTRPESIALDEAHELNLEAGKTIYHERYHLLKKLGSGATAEVWQAVDTLLGVVVALKILYGSTAQPGETLMPGSGTAKAQARREVLTALFLQHPNILRVLHMGQHQRWLFIVMQYIEGGTLRSIADSRPDRRLAVVEVLHYTEQVLKALRYAHEEGFLHGDIKPDNIMMDTSGPFVRARLADFGISRTLQELKTLDPDEVEVVGTPAYVAPEVVSAESTSIDHRADFYSVGIMMYELLAGSLPFNNPSMVQLVMAHIMEPPPPFERADVSPMVLALLHKCLEKKPEDRFQNAHEFLDALHECQHEGESSNRYRHLPTAAPTPPPTPVPQSKPKAMLGHSHTSQRELLAVVLNDMGYEVVQAGSTIEALSMFDRETFSLAVVEATEDSQRRLDHSNQRKSPPDQSQFVFMDPKATQFGIRGVGRYAMPTNPRSTDLALMRTQIRPRGAGPTA